MGVNDLGVGRQGEDGANAGAAQNVVDEIRAAGGQAVANTDDVTDWDAIQRLYASLVEITGNPVVRLNWAIARYFTHGLP